MVTAGHVRLIESPEVASVTREHGPGLPSRIHESLAAAMCSLVSRDGRIVGRQTCWSVCHRHFSSMEMPRLKLPVIALTEASLMPWDVARTPFAQDW